MKKPTTKPNKGAKMSAGGPKPPSVYNGFVRHPFLYTTSAIMQFWDSAGGMDEVFEMFTPKDFEAAAAAFRNIAARFEAFAPLPFSAPHPYFDLRNN